MSINQRKIWLATVAAVLIPVAAVAQAWNGLVKTDMDSIGATRDVSQSKVIPAPEPSFGGVIERNVYNSTAWWPPIHCRFDTPSNDRPKLSSYGGTKAKPPGDLR
jgi:hypothetical protein